MQDYATQMKMFRESDRLKTFKRWLFDETKACSAKKLAEAGFYFIGNKREPDSVQCFLCSKQLDGWEADDDPWKEHINHSPQCMFAQLQQPEWALSFEQFMNIRLELQRAGLDKLRAALDDADAELLEEYVVDEN